MVLKPILAFVCILFSIISYSNVYSSVHELKEPQEITISRDDTEQFNDDSGSSSQDQDINSCWNNFWDEMCSDD